MVKKAGQQQLQCSDVVGTIWDVKKWGTKDHLRMRSEEGREDAGWRWWAKVRTAEFCEGLMFHPAHNDLETGSYHCEVGSL